MNIIEVNPEELEAHEGNVRKKLGDLSGMVASMRSVGVLQPLLVAPVEGNGHYKILAGKRRAAAAIEAGLALVPCIVREDLAGLDMAAVSAIVENVQRADLSTVETARAFKQLSIAGLDVEAISLACGVDEPKVTAGLSIVGSKQAAKAAEKFEMTFAEGAALVEFESDEKSYKTLLGVAERDPERFMHTVSRLRQDRERREIRDAAVVKLEAQGITIYDGNVVWDAKLTQVCFLHDLVDDKGKPMSAAAHKKCPGHAVRVQVDHDKRVKRDTLCTDPKANGHKVAKKSSSNASDKDTAKRREVIDGNKAWRAATPVRREFVAGLLVRKDAPKGALRFAVEQIVEHGYQTDVGDHLPESEYKVVADLGKCTDAKLPMRLLAGIAVAREFRLNDVSVWRYGTTAGAQWLTFLAGCGYTLSEIEQRVVDHVEK